jgi:hypothetical protein
MMGIIHLYLGALAATALLLRVFAPEGGGARMPGVAVTMAAVAGSGAAHLLLLRLGMAGLALPFAESAGAILGAWFARGEAAPGADSDGDGRARAARFWYRAVHLPLAAACLLLLVATAILLVALERTPDELAARAQAAIGDDRYCVVGPPEEQWSPLRLRGGFTEISYRRVLGDAISRWLLLPPHACGRLWRDSVACDLHFGIISHGRLHYWSIREDRFLPAPPSYRSAEVRKLWRECDRG